MSLMTPRRDNVLAAHIAGVLTDVVDSESADSPRGSSSVVLERDELKAALSSFASGVTVVTGMHEGAPAGFTCQSFFSVSLEPPLVALSVMATSSTYPTIRTANRIAICVLGEDQQAVSTQFARSGTDKWAGIGWQPSPGGAPVIDDCLAWFECEIESEIEAGDHVVVLARITALKAEGGQSAPLLYWDGAYQRFAR